MSTTTQPKQTHTPPKALQLTAEASFDLEGAAGKDQPTSGAGGLPRFRMVAYTGSPMRIAGWRYPVIVDLAGLNIPSQTRPIRFSHDPASGVGHSNAIRIDGSQLVATGIVSRDTAAARETEALANAWDADATKVGITVDGEGKVITNQDDGIGMTVEDMNAKCLRVGDRRRDEGGKKIPHRMTQRTKLTATTKQPSLIQPGE